MLYNSSDSIERITAKKHIRNSVVIGLAPVINAFVSAVGYLFQREDYFFICKSACSCTLLVCRGSMYCTCIDISMQEPQELVVSPGGVRRFIKDRALCKQESFQLLKCLSRRNPLSKAIWEECHSKSPSIKVKLQEFKLIF